LFRCFCRTNELTVFSAEANGKGMYFVVALQGPCVSKNGAAIETATEQDSKRDVSAKMQGDAFLKSMVKLPNRDVKFGEVGFDAKIIIPVAVWRGGRCIERDSKGAPRRQLAYVAEMRTRGRQRKPSSKVNKRGAVQLTIDPRETQQGLELAC